MGLLSLIFYGIIISIATLIVYFAWVLYQRGKFFKKHGIPYLGAGFGKTLRTFTGSVHLINLEEEYYNEAKATNAPVVAFSEFTGNACLIIMDPEIIKRITVKDADHFINQREMNVADSSKYFGKMLFAMRDEQWKAFRTKMTPAFTTGKIRRMCNIFTTSSEKLDVYLKQQIDYPKTKSMDVDFFKILYKYSMDVIASCAFGIDGKSWETKMDEFSTFEKFGKQIEFCIGPVEIFKFFLLLAAPKIASLLKLDILDMEAQQYFEKILKDVIKQRRQTGERRDDFLQLMLDIQQGTLKADDDESTESSKAAQEISKASADKFVFNDEYVVANALLFFLGGLDTSQSNLLCTVYSLALEPEVQEKLHQEVRSVMQKHGGKLSYDALNEMTYLDMVLAETARLYPATTRLERECTSDYLVEEINFKIKKGTIVALPSHGIHTDPKYYENPLKYMPERFSPENKATRHAYTYMPFGHGPRSCIGMRFALMKVKAVIAQLVGSYKFTPCSKTKIPMEYDTSASVKPKGGLWLNITVREN